MKYILIKTKECNDFIVLALDNAGTMNFSYSTTTLNCGLSFVFCQNTLQETWYNYFFINFLSNIDRFFAFSLQFAPFPCPL